MTRTFMTLTLAAAAALAGCQEDHTLGDETAGTENQAVNTAGIELPPSISASKIYRCKDNSVVYIDWLSDNRSANVRTEKNGPPTMLQAPEEGQPMAADGFELTGTAGAETVTLARPGKGSQTCKA